MLRAEKMGHNSLRSDKCPISSNAFSREPRGSHARKSMHPCPEAVLRWEVAERKEWGGSVLGKSGIFCERGLSGRLKKDFCGCSSGYLTDN